MEAHTIILYLSLALFIASIVLWYISGSYLKKHMPALSGKFVYIGGFMFLFSITGVIAAIIIWLGK